MRALGRLLMFIAVTLVVIVGLVLLADEVDNGPSEREIFEMTCKAEGNFIEYKGRTRLWCIDRDRRILRELP